MTLVPFRKKEGWLDPFGELERLQDEMNKLFDFSLSRWPEKKDIERTWGPAIDVEEKEKEIVLKADLPGVGKNNVDISVEDDTLIIKGEKKEEKDEKRKGFRRRERFYGKFYRELNLPSYVDQESIKANYKSGVLTLTLPKKEEARKRGKRIEIE